MMVLDVQSRKNWNGVVNEIRSYELRGKKWNELFVDENELLEITKDIDTNEFERKGYNGYLFMRSFVRTLNSEDRELSPKQITQLKRMATEVYSYHWNKTHDAH